MKKMKKIIFCAVLIWLSAACGAVETHTNEGPSGPTTGDTPDPITEEIAVLLHITDFFSSAIISAATDLAETTPNAQTNIVAPVPHTDAMLRSFFGLLYIINRFGRDSIQVVDPGADFATVAEYSAGGGTNPQDLLVLSDSKAYLSLYQSEDVAGKQEVMVIHPQTGAVQKVIDLTGLTDDDGERLARPTLMTQVGAEIWVLIQDLDSSFQAVTNGKIAVINTASDSLVDVDPEQAGIQAIELVGYNPFDIQYNEAADLVYVSMVGTFNENFLTDLDNGLGGIETIDPESSISNGIVIADEALGGYPGRISMASETLGFTTSDSKRVVSFDPSALTVIDENLYESPGTFLPEILVDQGERLLITERGDATGQNAGLVIIDLESGTVRGPFDVGGPPNSMALVTLP